MSALPFVLDDFFFYVSCFVFVPSGLQDVLILRQFVDAYGNLLPQSVTQICGKAHQRMELAVEKAKDEGLLPKIPTEEEQAAKERGFEAKHRSAKIMWEQLRASGGLREDKYAELANVDQQVFK